MATNPEELNPKYCMFCGASLPEGATKCSKCGKDVAAGSQVLHDWKSRKEESKAKHTRICKNCNAIIESPLLLQCPLCGTALPEILPPEDLAGKYIFHGGKKQLVAAQELKLDPNTWKLREMGGVFMTSIVMFLFINFAVLFFLANPTSMIEAPKITMTLELVMTAVGIFLGIYPIIYVYMRKMNPSNKLGLKITPVGFVLGIIFGIVLYFALVAGRFLNDWLAALSPAMYNFFSLNTTTAGEELTLIQTAPFWEQILYSAFLLGSNIMEELLFRGVLLKGFDDSLHSRNRILKSVFLTAFMYSAIFAFLTWSFVFFITNFLMNLVLSIAFYLCKKSTSATIIAQCVFTVFYILEILQYFVLFPF